MVFGSAFYGSVGYGRLGEVGIGVVCKVLVLRNKLEKV